MRVPLGWLKEYVDFDLAPQDLAERLTMAGLEVEEIERLGEGLSGVVCAELRATRPHPNAERLTLCDVFDGEKTLQVVCGASNMKAGDKVALARVGAVLPPTGVHPEGLKIRKARIRGELSMGMLCSSSELGIEGAGGEDGILILPPDVVPGEDVAEVLGLKEIVLEVAITPNRPDCLGIVGVAREVAAVCGTELRLPAIELAEGGGRIEGAASVTVLDDRGCPRYSCRVVRGVRIAPSPRWMQARLEASGLRPINNVVDVTNYVMLELGQPLHAFDYDLVDSHSIVVRAAREGEVMETLDGVSRRLGPDDLLIADPAKPLAVAGVIGGASSEVGEDTRCVLLESAYFDPVRIRRTSKRLNVRTESSYRFERGVDPEGVTRALDRAAFLIARLAGGEVLEGRIDVYPRPYAPRRLELRPERVSALLGIGVDADEIAALLRPLGMEAAPTDEGWLEVTVPTWRVDVEREADLVEEVARLKGYSSIPSTLPSVSMAAGEVDEIERVAARVREVMVGSGFYECINYSFEEPERLTLFDDRPPLAIVNPLSVESSAMRTTLLAGLLRNAALNVHRQEQDFGLFELGRCFLPSENGPLPREVLRVGAVARGRLGVGFWERREEGVDFYDIKGVAENVLDALGIGAEAEFTPRGGAHPFLHPGKSATLSVGGRPVGYLGALHPRVQSLYELPRGELYVMEMELAPLARAVREGGRRFEPLPRFPSIRRDLALVVDEEVPVGDILGVVEAAGAPLVERAWVFDVYRGEGIDRGKKSVAISLVLRSKDKTLTDADAKAVEDSVLEALQRAFGAELRGG